MDNDKVFRTRELERTGRPADIVVWFRLSNGERLVIEMSITGLLQLQGLVDRTLDSFRAMAPDEMNAHASEQAGAKPTQQL